jgi:hypothetical protein
MGFKLFEGWEATPYELFQNDDWEANIWFVHKKKYTIIGASIK